MSGILSGTGILSREHALTVQGISSLALWLDASDATTLFDATSGGNLVAADGAVARWNDKSGNGRHAIQSTLGNRPFRRVAVANGWDAVHFVGTPHRLILASWPTNLTSATGFVVCRPDVSPDGNDGGLWHFGNRNDASFFSYASGGIGTIYDGFGLVDRVSAPAPYDLDQQVSVLEVQVSANVYSSWLQGAELTAPIAKTVGWNATPFVGSSGNYSLTGKIYELAIYAAALSASDRSVVRNLLATKWGAAVS